MSPVPLNCDANVGPPPSGDDGRFLKQSYQLEDLRLLRYERLRTMATLVLAAAHFIAVHLCRRAKLEIFAQHLLNAARRIYGVPAFRFYALADGIRQVLNSSRKHRPAETTRAARRTAATTAALRTGKSPGSYD